MSLISPDILTALQAHYAEPHRTYHNWHHIEAMLRWMNSGEFSVYDSDAIYAAILFHDAIYDAARKDNEECSALLAEDMLHSIFTPKSLSLVATLIRATTAHQMIDGLDAQQQSDLAHFLDMDLSILGSDWPIFEIYEENIRAEYAIYPDAIFWPGRAAVLENFLKRDRLFFSDWGYDRFEDRARINLQRAINLARRKAT